MGDMSLLASMAFSKAHQLDRDNRQANANIREDQEIIDRLYAQVQQLTADLRELELVRIADMEARSVELAAWREEHPVSHMHDVMGYFKDGDAMRRNIKIWSDTFDAACKKSGIRNPEAWRTT